MITKIKSTSLNKLTKSCYQQNIRKILAAAPETWPVANHCGTAWAAMSPAARALLAALWRKSSGRRASSAAAGTPIWPSSRRPTLSATFSTLTTITSAVAARWKDLKSILTCILCILSIVTWLNLLMVLWFWAQANFWCCTRCFQKWCWLQK